MAAKLVLTVKDFFSLLKKAVTEFIGHDVARYGAALAYYAAFAIAPLLLIAIAIGGFWFGKKKAQHELYGQLYGLMGAQGGSAVETLVTSAAVGKKTGLLATSIAIGAVFAGAMGVFVELRDSINAIWSVKTEPGHGLRDFIRTRLLSFAMVLGIGFLLMVSLILSSVLIHVSSAASFLQNNEYIFSGLNSAVSLAVITLLFAFIYKILPEVPVAWTDVWVGAFFAALLFELGKYLIGLYLAHSAVASIYGAAGSFMIMLTWVYYSAQILYFGALFTRLHSERRLGKPAHPTIGPTGP